MRNENYTGVAFRLRIVLTFCLVAVISFFPACGYRFSMGDRFPNDIRKLYIPVFENRTLQTGLEMILTNAIIDEFIRNGQMISSDRKNSDAVLCGRIMALKTQTVSRKGVASSSERRVTMTVSLELKGSDGSVLWSAKELLMSETYSVADERAETDDQRQIALMSASKKISERIYQQIMTEFREGGD